MRRLARIGYHKRRRVPTLSTYTSYALTGIKNREMLLAAIATMGLQAQVHEKATRLSGYYRTDNKMTAQIVIPKAEFTKIGTYSYLDIGFLEGTDGTFTCQTDGHLPTMVKDPKNPEGPMVKFEQAIQTAYARVNGDAAVKTILTKTIPRLKQLGKIPANATVRRQALPNGTTKVLVSY